MGEFKKSSAAPTEVKTLDGLKVAQCAMGLAYSLFLARVEPDKLDALKKKYPVIAPVNDWSRIGKFHDAGTRQPFLSQRDLFFTRLCLTNWCFLYWWNIVRTCQTSFVYISNQGLLLKQRNRPSWEAPRSCQWNPFNCVREQIKFSSRNWMPTSASSFSISHHRVKAPRDLSWSSQITTRPSCGWLDKCCCPLPPNIILVCDINLVHTTACTYIQQASRSDRD